MGALSALHETADAIVMYENDRLFLGSGGPQDGGGCSITEANMKIASDLLPALCPRAQSTHTALDLSTVTNAACPMPSHRFTRLIGCDAAGFHGPPTEPRPLIQAFGRAHASVLTKGNAGSGFRAPSRGESRRGAVISAHSSVRGVALEDVPSFQRELLSQIGGVVPWQPHPIDVQHSRSPLTGFPKCAKMATLLNARGCAAPIRTVVEQAR